MFHKIRYIILVGCVVAVSACSSANDMDNAGHNEPTQNRPKSHILRGQFNALDTSNTLQRSLNKTITDHLQAIEEATRSLAHHALRHTIPLHMQRQTRV